MWLATPVRSSADSRFVLGSAWYCAACLYASGPKQPQAHEVVLTLARESDVGILVRHRKRGVPQQGDRGEPELFAKTLENVRYPRDGEPAKAEPLPLAFTFTRRVAVLSKPFRASMRERPCAGDLIINPGRPGHWRTVTPLMGRRRHTRLPTDSTATIRHGTRLHSQHVRSFRRLQFGAHCLLGTTRPRFALKANSGGWAAHQSIAPSLTERSMSTWPNYGSS